MRRNNAEYLFICFRFGIFGVVAEVWCARVVAQFVLSENARELKKRFRAVDKWIAAICSR